MWVILHLASVYGIALAINRECPDDDLVKAYRKVALRCHPDKGGSTAHTKKLNAARDAWKEAQKAEGKSQQREQQRHVLCENELFLTGRDALTEYRESKVTLWHIPARSPDLNPVEKFWGWLRKELRRRDLADMVARRAVLGKEAYRARVRAVCRSAKAKRVAKNLARGLRKVCKEVITKGGAATRG